MVDRIPVEMKVFILDMLAVVAEAAFVDFNPALIFTGLIAFVTSQTLPSVIVEAVG